MNPDRRSRRVLVAAVAVGLVLVAAAFAYRTLTANRGPSGHGELMVKVAGPDVTTGPGPVGPTRYVSGIPVGWRHDQRGAEAAAAAFVDSSGTVATAGPLVRRDAVLTLATRGYGPALVEATDRQVDDLVFSLGQRQVRPADLVWREHALTVTSDVQSDDAVEVRVWSVLVVAVRGGSVPRQVWRTSTMAMRWVDGDWKVDRWSTDPGPFPAPPTEADVSSVDAVAAVASWRAAPSAGAS
jgi:hypothetical protein